MPSPARRAATIAALLGAGIATERVVVGRMRRRVDPQADALLRLPDDVAHHYAATHDGGRIHYVERGVGRPLVLLHGVTLSAGIWSPLLHLMAGTEQTPGHRVIAVDLRGHADSVPGSDGFGLPALGHDVATLLEHLDLHDAILVGHSMGGMTIMRFANDHPDVFRRRVAAVAFVATSGVAPFPIATMERLQSLGATVVERLDSGLPVPAMRFTGNDLSLLLVRLAFGRHPSAAALEQVRASIEAMEPESLHRSVVGILHHHSIDHLPRLEVPAVVVCGTHDRLTAPHFSRHLAEVLPDAELTLLPGIGHQIMQEAPEDLVEVLRQLDHRAGGAAGPGSAATDETSVG